MSRRIGDVRADGAVCVKIEWVSRDACGSGFYGAPLGVDATRDIKRARRFAKREEAEDKELDWEAVRVVTWRKPKRTACPIDHFHGHWCPTNTAIPSFVSPYKNRDAIFAIDKLVSRADDCLHLIHTSKLRAILDGAR